ncbi:MAG: hypothetical protein ABL921_34820, partial [Pirellula sp.]
MMRYLVVLLILPTMFGCGNSVESVGEVKKVTGKAVAQDGSALGNVLVVLQPTENGYVTELEANKNGEFEGEAIPGKYVFYFAASKKVKSQIPNTVPTQYQTPKMEHLVDVGPSQE